MKIKTTRTTLTRASNEIGIKLYLKNCDGHDLSYCNESFRDPKVWRDSVLEELKEEKAIAEALEKAGLKNSMKYYQELEDLVNENRQKYGW